MGSRGADRLPIRRLHVLAPQCLREQIGGAGPRLIVGARCLLPRCVDFLEVGGDLKNRPPAVFVASCPAATRASIASTPSAIDERATQHASACSRCPLRVFPDNFSG